jgi:membrane protein YqaA with SNARE-associated domain
MFKGWLSTLVFSLPGMWLLAALDSTPFFKLPLGIDTAVMVVSSLHPEIFWLCGLTAAVASLGGAALTFYIGRRAGEVGLCRFMSEQRAKSVKSRVHANGAITLALLDLVPPPFPFTACILAAGALEVDRKRFFLTLFLGRCLRFGLESTLAVIYGPRIIRWMESWNLYNSVALLLAIGVAAGVAMLIATASASRVRRQ